MKLSRKTKKLLKTYATYKGARFLGGYGLAASLGLGLYRWWRNRRVERDSLPVGV